MQFDEYVHAQRQALMRFATVLTGRTWLAEDVVSDVPGRAFERWDRIAATDQPHAYVRRMSSTSTSPGSRAGLPSEHRPQPDLAGAAVILMHLSTERDPKGGGPAITSRLPLSVQQMTDFVSSDQW